MPNRWRVVVELTYDIDTEKDIPKYTGDTETDVAQRALERVRPSLNSLVEGAFAHYHILEAPKRISE